MLYHNNLLDKAMAQNDQLRARIAELEAALRDAYTDLAEAFNYVVSYIDEPHIPDAQETLMQAWVDRQCAKEATRAALREGKK